MELLNTRDIVRIQDTIVQTTGGSLGLREPGLLEAIANKPHVGFGGQDLYPTLFDKAAAVFEALCNYHVFVDGNKRTAITCLEYILHLNNLRLTASADERERFVLQSATSRPEIAEVAAWIKANSRAEGN